MLRLNELDGPVLGRSFGRRSGRCVGAGFGQGQGQGQGQGRGQGLRSGQGMAGGQGRRGQRQSRQGGVAGFGNFRFAGNNPDRGFLSLCIERLQSRIQSMQQRLADLKAQI